ncbi:hypothetical protein B0I35DRAFT_513162 [Stachybotrys elegans]|uniref:Uncharacterized protein n=1 Tax=Stachybotrys elegans TaxID=80388 RepID=A0A8K0WQ97_9HYPO|nr:hypothetical protein B0I35DRAFT_513162 [Stachybotrys elegans]
MRVPFTYIPGREKVAGLVPTTPSNTPNMPRGPPTPSPDRESQSARPSPRPRAALTCPTETLPDPQGAKAWVNDNPEHLLFNMGGTEALTDQHDFQPPSQDSHQGAWKPMYTPGSMQQEAICARRTFYVNLNGKETPRKYAIRGRNISMYVESHEPVSRTQALPIILIHGDHHTGQASHIQPLHLQIRAKTEQVWLTKPDGNPGWVSWFVKQGYHVYTCDLPPSGRSNFLNRTDFDIREPEDRVDPPPVSEVQKLYTAKNRASCPSSSTALPNQWPGTGHRGDPIFDSYYASLETVHLGRMERQTLAQDALRSLLDVAADVAPELVASIVAIAPDGPPCAVGFHEIEGRLDGKRIYKGDIIPGLGRRQYGLADIPLTYDPPAALDFDLDDESKTFKLDIEYSIPPGSNTPCMMQRPVERRYIGSPDEGYQEGPSVIRQLVNLGKIPHAVFTGQTSAQRTCDFAMADFMTRAGLPLTWLKLADLGIVGNGPLMFLEENSDLIAKHIHVWVQGNVMITADEVARLFSDSFQSNASSGMFNIPTCPLMTPGIPPTTAHLDMYWDFNMPFDVAQVQEKTMIDLETWCLGDPKVPFSNIETEVVPAEFTLEEPNSIQETLIALPDHQLTGQMGSLGQHTDEMPDFSDKFIFHDGIVSVHPGLNINFDLTGFEDGECSYEQPRQEGNIIAPDNGGQAITSSGHSIGSEGMDIVDPYATESDTEMAQPTENAPETPDAPGSTIPLYDNRSVKPELAHGAEPSQQDAPLASHIANFGDQYSRTEGNPPQDARIHQQVFVPDLSLPCRPSWL